jgi:transposase-like protein
MEPCVYCKQDTVNGSYASDGEFVCEDCFSSFDDDED